MSETLASDGVLARSFMPEAVADLLGGPSSPLLARGEKAASLMFADISALQDFSGEVDMDSLGGMISDHVGLIEGAVTRGRGVPISSSEDSVLSLWNAPVPCPDHQAAACAAAVDAAAALGESAESCLFGVASGPVFAGLMRYGWIQRYGAFGPTLAQCKLIAGANRFFKTKVLASAETYAPAREVVAGRPIGAVRLVGRREPVELVELISRRESLSAAWKEALPAFAEGLAHCRRREFSEAASRFEEVSRILPGDVPAKIYTSMSRDYAVIAPPEGWEPVFNLTSR